MRKIIFIEIILVFIVINVYTQSKYNDFKIKEKIFYDDFSTNNSGWRIGTINSNVYQISNGYYELISTSDGATASNYNTNNIFTIDQNKNFEIELSMAFISGEENGGNGIWWGVKSSNWAGFQFVFSGNGSFRLSKYYNGTWNALKDWTKSDLINKNDYNKMTIRKIDNQYYFFINDGFVHSCPFESFYGNEINFCGTKNSIIRIEYIKISYIEKTALNLSSISWINPSDSYFETSDLQYQIKATIKSEKQIKSIKIKSGNTTLSTETYFPLSNGQGTFEKNITLNAGTNQITIVVENENGTTTSTSRIIKYNEPQIPPILSVSDISFTDKNNNNRIDGNEECNIKFSILNKGKGSARNLKVLVQNNSAITGLAFSNSITLGTIAPNATQTVSIPISGTMDLKSGTSNVKISFEEQMGFPPDPIELNIETKEFIKPDVKVVDNSFLTDNGSIKLGLPIQLKVLIQNVGQGTAEDVSVSFSYPGSNVFANGEKDFVIGTMQAGATKELVFEFIANKLYTEKTIPINIKITEKLGKFSQNKQVIATIDAKTSGNAITIASNAKDNVVNIQVASLTADVDKNIPQNAIKYPNRYALIIGNEDYSGRQSGLSSEVNVAFAINDAKTFRDYAINTFGVEEKNCFFLTNATAGEMSQKIELVSQILSRLGENGELIFYYAGHGFPDENTKIPYLIPVDVSASNLQSAIKLTDIYNKFSETKAKRITIFLDACFTGGGRDQGLIAARSVKIKPKFDNISGNVVVFTATSEDQSALPYKDKQHGIFTYFLLKKLQESKGEITYGEIEKYLKENVSIESLKINSKVQDPKVNVSNDAQGTWSTWKIK